MFKRILIANRGEIACRIMRTCRTMKIETVAVYSEADANARHVKEADVSVRIGGPPASERYLDMFAILDAAARTEAQAIHPGYGFLAENALFAELCRQRKVTFIGPSPRVMRLMGDKATARRTVREFGIPVVPGSDSVVAGVDEAEEVARKLGFPVLLKATAGGGGRGLRVCRNRRQLRRLFPEAAMEAEKSFGDHRLYVERFIENGRHIEFQFLGDGYGHAVHLGERECSVQRQHQKLLEESPSPALDGETRRAFGRRVAGAFSSLGYAGAGTMEFLRDAGGGLHFMEVNTRLQVEHPVTEMSTGLDLVAEQIRVAANHRLSVGQEEVAFGGHTIECRINAEDPEAHFRPSPGRVVGFEPPRQAPGVELRLDSGVETGAEIPVQYDSLICKLLAHGPDRDTTRLGMLEALERFRIEGVKTTVPLFRRVLADERFVSGNYDTGLLKAMGIAS